MKTAKNKLDKQKREEVITRRGDRYDESGERDVLCSECNHREAEEGEELCELCSWRKS